ncbi:endoglucanase precursor [Neocallimastix californiae]|uniref:Endoglucanase n=1 Tax=Neocallimastix californiae TaxID=1754190 RepID=A0A1Y2FT82_9FUNG|nr:endoglucanase precursor [Neocallimastix californiae]|eukprot:ORY87221.1 endoglucanase precursor [Neocallimastix californiae]
MKSMNILLVVFFAITSSNAFAINKRYFRDITPKQLLNEINFGYNLGNTMESKDKSLFNTPEYDVTAETRWGNVKTHEGIFTTLMDNKFNIFRIPTTWSGHFDEAPDYKIHDVWMKRVREIVDYAYNNGAYVILNTQHETWMDTYYHNYENAKNITEKLWTQIAEEFKDYDEHLIFESFNEPRMGGSPVEWKGGNEEGRDVVNKLNNDFVKIVRKTGGNNSKQGNDKVIADIHAYLPYDFALNPGPGFNTYFTEEGQEVLDLCLERIKERFFDNNEPVILGEFGCQHRNNLEERIRWTEYYVRQATALGIRQLWWDNGIIKREGERLGLLDQIIDDEIDENENIEKVDSQFED